MGRTQQRIHRALQAIPKGYARTAFPAEAAGAVLTTGFVALVLADAWIPGFRVMNQGPLTAAAAMWMLAAITVYMLYAACRCMESSLGPEAARGWKQAAWGATLWLPLGLIAAGLLTTEIWESEEAKTAAGYTLFAGLAGAALRTTAGLSARIRRKLGERTDGAPGRPGAKGKEERRAGTEGERR